MSCRVRPPTAGRDALRARRRSSPARHPPSSQAAPPRSHELLAVLDVGRPPQEDALVAARLSGHDQRAHGCDSPVVRPNREPPGAAGVRAPVPRTELLELARARCDDGDRDVGPAAPTQSTNFAEAAQLQQPSDLRARGRRADHADDTRTKTLRDNRGREVEGGSNCVHGGPLLQLRVRPVEEQPVQREGLERVVERRAHPGTEPGDEVVV